MSHFYEPEFEHCKQLFLSVLHMMKLWLIGVKGSYSSRQGHARGKRTEA